MSAHVVSAPDAAKAFDDALDAAGNALTLSDPLVGKGYRRASRIEARRQRRARKSFRVARRAALAITHFAAPLANARRLLRGTTRQLLTAEAQLRRERRRLQRALWWQEHRETVIRLFWLTVLISCLMLVWSYRQEIETFVRNLVADLFASVGPHSSLRAQA